VTEIVVTPRQPDPNKRWVGLFEARVGERLLCTSRQPFLDSARVLVAEGLDPDSTITMRHAGSATVALTARLGVAARLQVNEDGPRFGAWRPWDGERFRKVPPNIDETSRVGPEGYLGGS
jgi:hypothetical protein